MKPPVRLADMAKQALAEWVDATPERQAVLEAHLERLADPRFQLAHMGKIVWDGEKEIGPFYTWKAYEERKPDQPLKPEEGTELAELPEKEEPNALYETAKQAGLFGLTPDKPVDLFAQ